MVLEVCNIICSYLAPIIKEKESEILSRKTNRLHKLKKLHLKKNEYQNFDEKIFAKKIVYKSNNDCIMIPSSIAKIVFDEIGSLSIPELWRCFKK